MSLFCSSQPHDPITTLICRAHYPAMNSLVGFLVDECCADAGCAARQGEAAA